MMKQQNFKMRDSFLNVVRYSFGSG